jgi:hypothetical protein
MCWFATGLVRQNSSSILSFSLDFDSLNLATFRYSEFWGDYIFRISILLVVQKEYDCVGNRKLDEKLEIGDQGNWENVFELLRDLGWDEDSEIFWWKDV